MTIVVRDKLWIDGRGQVFVADPKDNAGVDLGSLMGQTVRIEGGEWVVRGIESFTIENAARHFPVGLLVAPLCRGSGVSSGA